MNFTNFIFLFYFKSFFHINNNNHFVTLSVDHIWKKNGASFSQHHNRVPCRTRQGRAANLLHRSRTTTAAGHGPHRPTMDLQPGSSPQPHREFEPRQEQRLGLGSDGEALPPRHGPVGGHEQSADHFPQSSGRYEAEPSYDYFVLPRYWSFGYYPLLINFYESISVMAKDKKKQPEGSWSCWDKSRWMRCRWSKQQTVMHCHLNPLKSIFMQKIDSYAKIVKTWCNE